MKRHTREAKNRCVDLPVCRSKLTISALCLLLGSCAIEEALPLTWDFSFQCQSDADRTKLVELQVAQGGCPITGPVVFRTVKSTWNSPASRPQGLPSGSYAFQGTAWDANDEPIASRCEIVEIPMKGTIGLHLQGAAECGSNDIDSDEDWDEDPDGTWDWDAATPPDAGSELDAAVPPDAGQESDAGECSDDSDRDSDGVTDCIDECPDDSAKTTVGQCGCGKTDLDFDGDGTANCVDGCPADANKTEPGVCGCNPKTKLGPSETLTVGQYLCGPIDDSVRFAMEADGRLHVRVDGVQLWVSDKGSGTLARMQGDGNLVIKNGDMAGAPWASGTVYKVDGPDGPNTVTIHNMSFLEVHANGTVTISHGDNVVWTVP